MPDTVYELPRERAQAQGTVTGKIMVSVVASMLVTAIVGGVTQYTQYRNAKVRRSLQGVWVLKARTAATDLSDYQDMTVDYMLSITVDSSYSVSGVAYKLREHSRKGEVDYQRASRPRAVLSGSIINDRVVLNLDSVDSAGRPSVQTFDGTVTAGDGPPTFQGFFISDVANQAGQFCSSRVDMSAPSPWKSIPGCHP